MAGHRWLRLRAHHVDDGCATSRTVRQTTQSQVGRSSGRSRPPHRRQRIVSNTVVPSVDALRPFGRLVASYEERHERDSIRPVEPLML
jgi:hypothetical protein